MSLPDPSATLEISVNDAANLIENAEETILLIDCREPDEFDMGSIEGADLAPLSNFEVEAETLFADESELALIYCHHGGRSLKATEWLRNKGYENTFSIKGGIDEWAVEIDSNIPRY